MSREMLYLARTLRLAAILGLAACTTSPPPSPTKPAAKAVPRKDYSSRRIGGREELQMPGIGTVHADKRVDVEGGVLLSGRVFLEISPPTSDGKPWFLYAYAERARINSRGSILCLDGWAVVEGDNHVHQSTEAGTRIFFDETGKMTTQGGHETISY